MPTRKPQTFSPVRASTAYTQPSALPAMARRRPPRFAVTGVDCVLRSAGAPPGVETQISSPVFLSKPNSRWRGGPSSPQLLETKVTISRSPSTTGVWVRPP